MPRIGGVPVRDGAKDCRPKRRLLASALHRRKTNNEEDPPLVAFAALSFPAAAFAKDAQCAIKYTGWHCAGCAKKVEAAIKKLDGVKTVKVTKKRVAAIKLRCVSSKACKGKLKVPGLGSKSYSIKGGKQATLKVITPPTSLVKAA